MHHSITLRLPLLLFVLSIHPGVLFPVLAQTWEMTQKLGSSDQQPGDNLGISTAISGDYLIAGAWWDEGEIGGGQGMTSAGAAYIYKLQPNGTWQELQKLVSPNREALGYFGFHVAIDGDYALVGAFNEDHSGAGNAGRVYAYHRDANDDWILDGSLITSNPGNNEYFGNNLAIAGDYALIGADGHDYDEAGANFLSDAGAAFLFKRQANNSYTQIQKFVAFDRAEGDKFGKHVDIDNQGLVIGVFRKAEGIGEFETGAAYGVSCTAAICDFEGFTSADLKKFVAPDQNNFEYFGWDVAISGNWVVAGKSSESDQPGGGSGNATGAAYFFHWENGNWVMKQKVYAPDFSAFARFGRAIAMDGPVCVIGAGSESDDANGQNTVSGAGAAYVFELQNNNQWMPKQKLAGTRRGIGDLFGEDAVGVSGSRIVVGAWLADTLMNDEIIDGGAVYVFERDSPITAVRAISKTHSVDILNNPSLDGWLRIQQKESNTAVIESVNVFSMDGHMLLSTTNRQETTFQADLALVPAGIYVVHVKTEDQLTQILKWVRL